MEAAALTPGTVVERYTVEGLIGEGGMAMVFRVRHNALGTVHALKVLTLASSSIRLRLKREGQMQAALRHPNIVAVTDVVEIAGATALVLELVEGPSLDVVLRVRRLEYGEIDLLAPGILAGVAAAHHQGYVHRDLKPANVLLAPTAAGVVPKVADFGLAKVAAGSDSGLGSDGARTRTGSTMGTPQYMSPEQIRDTKSVGPASDVFALGAILYEMVTGRRAFDSDDLLDIYNAVAAARYTPVRELAPDAPERMVQAIDAALQVNAAERPTVLGLAEIWGADLAAIRPVSMVLPAATTPSVRPPETWTSAVPVGVTIAPPAPAPSDPRLTRAAWAVGLGGSLAAAVGFGSAAIMALALAGWWWFGPPPEVQRVVVEVPVPVPVRNEAGTIDVNPTLGDETEIPEVAPPLDGPQEMKTLPPDAPRGGEGVLAEVDPAGDASAPDPRAPAESTSGPPARTETAGPETAGPETAETSRTETPTSEPSRAAPGSAKVVTEPGDPDARIATAERFARRIGEPGAVERLIALATVDRDERVQRSATDLAIALYTDGQGELEPAVLHAMAHAPEGQAIRALDAFRLRGDDPRRLSGALAHRAAPVRLVALKVLPVIAPRTPDGVVVDYDALIAPLLGEDQPPVVQRAAAEALRKL